MNSFIVPNTTWDILILKYSLTWNSNLTGHPGFGCFLGFFFHLTTLSARDSLGVFSRETNMEAPASGYEWLSVWDSGYLLGYFWPWLQWRTQNSLSLCVTQSADEAASFTVTSAGLWSPRALRISDMHVASRKMTCHRSVKSKNQIYLIQHPSGSLQLCHWGGWKEQSQVCLLVKFHYKMATAPRPLTQDTIRNTLKSQETISLARNK